MVRLFGFVFDFVWFEKEGAVEALDCVSVLAELLFEVGIAFAEVGFVTAIPEEVTGFRIRKEAFQLAEHRRGASVDFTDDEAVAVFGELGFEVV